MNRKKWTALLVVAVVGVIMALMCVGSFAVNPTDVSVSAQIAPTIQLDMPDTTVDFGGAGLAPGAVYSDSVTATVNSNRAWRLDVVKDQDLTSPSGTIPSSQLTFGAAGVAPFTPTYVAPAGTEFGSSATEVVAGARGSSLQSTISYSLNVTWDIQPDTYTATHTYTATQP
ncbi:MAG: hypothetical protein JW738_08390 [Actinobacteria bacterium]|nr:hypothetical protein [Actinomycetota bacterium]